MKLFHCFVSFKVSPPTCSWDVQINVKPRLDFKPYIFLRCFHSYLKVDSMQDKASRFLSPLIGSQWERKTWIDPLIHVKLDGGLSFHLDDSPLSHQHETVVQSVLVCFSITLTLDKCKRGNKTLTFLRGGILHSMVNLHFNVLCHYLPILGKWSSRARCEHTIISDLM